MRIKEISNARPWRNFRGPQRPCLIKTAGKPVVTIAQYGLIETGRQRVFQGYFVSITISDGHNWLGEDQHSLREALYAASREAALSGWQVVAIGLDIHWHETGLSWNTGLGFHPDFEQPVHMLDAPKLL